MLFEQPPSVVRYVALIIVMWIGCADLGCEPVRADTVPYRHFTAFDGLPSENITALDQTPDGLLWIGTETGVAVYDGAEIRRIELPDSVGTAYISTVRALPDGSVWVTPSRGEAVKLRYHGVEQSVELGNRIVQQIVTREDTLFFVTRQAVWRLLPGEETASRQPFQYDIRPEELGSNPEVGAGVFNAGRGPDGAIWVVDGHLGPGRLRPDGSVDFVGAGRKYPGDFWYDIQFTDNGTGLLLQGEQLHRLDPRRDTLAIAIEGLGDPTYLSVHGNRAYVTRNRTLLRYDVDGDRMLSSLGPAQGLPDRVPIEVYHDREGGLWIGTQEGLLSLSAPEARHVESIQGQPVFNVVQFLDHESGFWAHTYGAGFLQLRPTRRHVTPNGLVGWRQRVQSQDGDLHAISTETRDWYRWDGEGDWERVGATNGAMEGVVGPEGNGYFLHDGGLYRHEPERTGPVEELATWHPDNTHAHDVALFPNGDLLHRSRTALLRRRRPDGAVLDTVAVLSEDPERNISQMVVDPKGRIWCAYRYGGLSRVDPGSGEHRMLLEEQRMWGIELTSDRFAIASTRQEGAFLFDLDTGDAQRQLTRADGLRSNTVMTAHLADDSLFLGHDNGVTRLPADDLSRTDSSPPTLLTGLEVNLDERLPTTDSLLDVSERSVGFSYVAPSLAGADRLQYEVRLLPEDTTWGSTTHRFTRYTSLEPGNYRFEVRARDGQQPPGSVAAHSFAVPPYFYETWWFRFLVVFAVVALYATAYRWRTYQLRRRQEELEAAVEDRTQALAREKRKTEAQAERLAELDEAKNRFFAHISHEFRTPLSLILSPLQEALRRGTSLGTEQMERMTKNARRLQRLIKQLLDLATLEAGRMELDRRPGALGGLVERTAEAFRSRAERKGVDLTINTPSDRVETQFDPEKVETIATNLVANALKFTPDGGSVHVRVGETKETNRVARQEDDAEVRRAAYIEVEDTGPGIDPDAQDQIFNRFTQSRELAGDAPESDGLGLGLALTSELVALHGGTIDVESVPDEGSTFTVYLPLLPVGDLETEDLPEDSRDPVQENQVEHGGQRTTSGDGVPGEEEQTEKKGGDTSTILVVEDNAEMRAYLREQLSHQWTIVEAADGDEAWRMIQNEAPDLVLSDVMMPGLNGFELCERIKGEERLWTIPVLLLTARADEQATLEGLEVGADDYVAKPFSAEELRQRIENHLAARRHLRTRYQEELRVEALGVTIGEEDRPFVETLIETAGERIHDPDFTVGDLADELALSRRQLTRRVKGMIDETPGAVLRQLRIERAKAHLQDGVETVAEVAYASGFRSPSAFSQSFRKAVGCTPTEYADRHAD